MTIKITFLGTADSIPSARRNHTSILLNYYGENILIDCGEGTQKQFRHARLNPCKIDKILLTHLHGDHVLGLPGLLETLGMSGYNKTLNIYGPVGTKSFMNIFLRLFPVQNKIKLKVQDVSGSFFENSDFCLISEKMSHGVACNAYCFVKKGSLRIDKKKLEKSKLPQGPLLKDLSLGKDVMFKGKKYLAKNLTYKEEDKKICFVLDTKMNSKIVPFVKGADLLICEASFDSSLEEHAVKHKHLVASQAGKIAKDGKVKKLMLTHISQRYDKNNKIILDEAKKYFKGAVIAKDLDVVEL